MIDNPNGITIGDTVINTWFERDRAQVALWMKDADGEQGQELIAIWHDEDVASLVEDGFLNNRDWHGSAFEYAASLGLLNAANRVEVEAIRTGWVLVHEEDGVLLGVRNMGWNRGLSYIWSGSANVDQVARGATVFGDEEHALGFILEDMPEDEAEEMREKLAAYEFPLDTPVNGQKWNSRVSVASIEGAGLIRDMPGHSVI
jgi:hypothetical protein